MEFIDLKQQYIAYQADIDEHIHRVISSAKFIMGPQIAELETTLAAFSGTQHAVSCASGTDALMLALMTYNIQADDEIITPVFSFIAAAEAIAFLGAKPVFVDINPLTYNIDVEQCAAAITPRTRGIVAVDLFGQCADYDALTELARQHDLFLIEDAAQSFGATYKERRAGSLGDVACTSFFPAKPLGCFGDGGMIFTNDTAQDGLLRSLRMHGQGAHKYDTVRIGLNARMDTLQAAVLLGKWPHFGNECEARERVARYYTDKLKDYVRTPAIATFNRSVFAQYCILVPERNRLVSHLRSEGIPTAIHYPKPLHLQPVFAYLGYTEGQFPIAENASAHILALPMHPFLTSGEQDLVIEKILFGLSTTG